MKSTDTDSVVRLSIWSSPRNISTALMYSFAQRSDTYVVDEPLYAHYLTHTKTPIERAEHPGEADIIASQNTSGEQVVKEVILRPQNKPVLFLKNMTHHLVALDWAFIGKLHNVILTRDPYEMIHSYTQNVTDPRVSDTGFDKQVALLTYLQAQGQTPMVIDAQQLLQNPRQVLIALCDHVNIPFEEAMLHWHAGVRPEDGVWAPYWYANVHKSTGFAPYRPKEITLPNRLRPLLEACLPLYEQLKAHAILPSS